jgi:predicted nucleotidyltransferase
MAYLYFDKHGYGEPFVYIHPFKQAAAKHLAENIMPGITHVIVFGSAVLPCCRSWSDVDVCLIGDMGDDVLLSPLKKKGESYDFLKYASLDELHRLADRSIQNVEKSIVEKGVLVYER